MNHVSVAREVVSSYNTIAGMSFVDLQSIVTVLVGSKATPELTSRLSAYGIKELVSMTMPELELIGLTKAQAERVHAGCLLARQYKAAGPAEERYTIKSPKDAADLMMDELSGINQEHFVVAYLNIKNQVIHKETVFIGSLNASIVHPREIFRVGVKHAAASIVAYHTHPSGNPLPSPEDIAVTKRLAEAGSIVGIELLDHIIIGDHNYCSLNEKGYID